MMDLIEMEKFDINNPQYRVGQKIQVKNGHIRIMAIAENYIMARRKGAMPFVNHVTDFHERIKEELKLSPENNSTSTNDTLKE